MADTIEDWKIEVLKILGEKQLKAETTERTSDSPLNKAIVRQSSDVLPDVTMPGNPPPVGRMGKFLASNLFGSKKNRQDHGEEETKVNLKKIQEKEAKGESAPVQLVVNDRVLKGHFHSANGHNLKSEDYKPDLSRPVVLLLTGSGGSAENQGFDVADMYSKNGASVLSVNYGGYGDSDDTEVSEKSVNEDAQAMLKHLIELGYDPDKIIIHGYSMGGAIAGQLAGAYESTDKVKFRGVVQDRPMTSSYDGVMGHFGILGPLAMGVGELTSNEVGKMSGKEGMFKTDRETRKVVTSDKGRFARVGGDKLRDKLSDEGHLVTGQRSEKEHEDHQGMIETNQDELLNLVRFDREGKEGPKRLEMELVFSELNNEILDDCRAIYPILQEGKRGVEGKLDDAMKRITDVLSKFQQLDSTGLDKTKRFQQELSILGGWKKKMETYRGEIVNAMREQTGKNPYAGSELVRLSPQAVQLCEELELAGGPDPKNKPIEDRILSFSTEFEKLVDEVENPNSMLEQIPDIFKSLKMIQDTAGAIREKRLERVKQVEYTTVELSQFPKQKDLAEDARQKVRKETDDDFKKLKAEDEDVSASRLIGSSSDKGFRKAVVEPVERILVKVREFMNMLTPKPMTPDTFPELFQVRGALEAAKKLYAKKRDETNQKKNPKDYAQRQKKVDAIEQRLNGLDGVIQKHNNAAQLMQQEIESHRNQSMDALNKAGGVDKSKLVLGSLHGDMIQSTGNDESDKEAKERATKNAQAMGDFISNLDQIQREAIGRSKPEPRGLVLALAKAGSAAEDVVNALIDEAGDDEEYLLTLLDAAVEHEFATTKKGSKALRDANSAVKIVNAIAKRGGTKQFADTIRDEAIEEMRGKKLDVTPPEPLGPKATPKQKQEYEQKLVQVQQNIEKHAQMISTLLDNLLDRKVPPEILKVAASIYESSIKKDNDEAAALAYIGGLVVLRIVAPAITTYDFGDDLDGKQTALIQNKLLQSLANGVKFNDDKMKPFDPLIDKYSDRLRDYFRSIVKEGQELRDGFDLGELADEVMQSRSVVTSTFAVPTPDDPLGTLPDNTSTPLGRAILRVRDKRNQIYDWDALQSMPKPDFDDAVYEERLEVLELVRDEN